MLRKDFVQHSNDSAWMVNPAQPLTGYSPLISQDSQPLGLRSRFALDRLSTLAQTGKVGAADLQRMVMDDQGVAFDPQDPQRTPRGIAVDHPQVAKALRAAMLASAEQVKAAGLKPDSHWGDIQVASSGGQQTPIHGGPGALGIYNAIQSVPRSDGKREVVSGTSYLQVVTFDENGPQAKGLLAFSLSSDPASKYSRD